VKICRTCDTLIPGVFFQLKWTPFVGPQNGFS
jgi:hypothetical protein